MRTGQELLLGASGTQESPLGLNEAEPRPMGGDAPLDVIARISARYEHEMGSKARHCMEEIASALRKQGKAGAAGRKGESQ